MPETRKIFRAHNYVACKIAAGKRQPRYSAESAKPEETRYSLAISAIRWRSSPQSSRIAASSSCGSCGTSIGTQCFPL